MFDMQTVFYGLCGLLVALSISNPSFYIKHGRTVVALAWTNAVVILVLTYMVMQVAEDVVAYRDYIMEYSEKLVKFYVEDIPVTCMYMFLSEVLNENLIYLAKCLEKHNKCHD
ncbi:TPA: hypothetical protein ACSP84_003350 [Aeromonas veronii]